MDVKIDGIVDFLKLPSYILGALAIASGLLLFLPDSIIQSLYMTDFRDKYGFTIGIIFVVSLSILMVLSARWIYKSVQEKRNIEKLKKTQVNFLKMLSSDKASLIIAFLQEPTRTMLLPMNDGLIIELQHYSVISSAGQNHLVSMIDPQINFFLQPWVEERIKTDNELKAKYGM